MAALETASIAIPGQVADEIWSKVAQKSVLAQLCGETPMKYGEVSEMVFTSEPKAELVGEGAAKSPTPGELNTKKVVPRKFQVTFRISNEVMWADEDYQLGVLAAIEEKGSLAIGRALDIIGIHKINPLSGTAATSVTECIAGTANAVILGDSTDYVAAVESAQDLVIADGYIPTGYAFDTAFANCLRKQRNANGMRLEECQGVKLNGVGEFDGTICASSDTVSALKEAKAATGIKAICGDFGAFKWGVQRGIAAELIEYGDPDGLGDLKRNNQVAVRLEVVYGIGIMDANAFAVIKA